MVFFVSLTCFMTNSTIIANRESIQRFSRPTNHTIELTVERKNIGTRLKIPDRGRTKSNAQGKLRGEW